MKINAESIRFLFLPCPSDNAGGDITRTAREIVENGTPICPLCGNELRISNMAIINLANCRYQEPSA